MLLVGITWGQGASPLPPTSVLIHHKVWLLVAGTSVHLHTAHTLLEHNFVKGWIE